MASFKRTAAVWVACLTFVFVAAATPASGLAQARGKKKTDEPKRQRFDSHGTIEALLPNSIIKFTLSTKESWFVKLEAPKRHRDKKTRQVTYKGGTEVQVTGTAVKEFLRPGMFVRFSAALNAKGRSSEEIDLLTIFTPNEQRKLGIFREGFAEEEEQDNTTRYLVAGQLASFKKGRLSVAIGRRKVQVTVAADATIKVDVNDLSLVRPGDKIEVKGHFFKKGAVLGKTVTIELRQPLGVAQEKKKKTPRSRRRSPKKPAAEKTSPDEPAPKKEQDSEKNAGQDAKKK